MSESWKDIEKALQGESNQFSKDILKLQELFSNAKPVSEPAFPEFQVLLDRSKFIPKLPEKKKTNWIRYSLAAILFLGVSISLFVFTQFQKPQSTILETTVQGITKDWKGYSLEIQPNSLLEIPNDTPNTIHIKKGGLKLSSTPIKEDILVRTKYLSIKPIGTIFQVSAGDTKATVTVIQGEVEVSNSKEAFQQKALESFTWVVETREVDPHFAEIFSLEQSKNLFQRDQLEKIVLNDKREIFGVVFKMDSDYLYTETIFGTILIPKQNVNFMEKIR